MKILAVHADYIEVEPKKKAVFVQVLGGDDVVQHARAFDPGGRGDVGAKTNPEGMGHQFVRRDTVEDRLPCVGYDLGPHGPRALELLCDLHLPLDGGDLSIKGK